MALIIRAVKIRIWTWGRLNWGGAYIRNYTVYRPWATVQLLTLTKTFFLSIHGFDDTSDVGALFLRQLQLADDKLLGEGGTTGY